MAKLPVNVINFAAGNTALYEKFIDYWKHYLKKDGEYDATVSFSEKEEKLNAAMKKEILRVAGITNLGDFPLESWSSHPTLNWATFAVVSAMIDAILPQTIIDSIGIYTDVRTIGYGDSAAFDVEPRDLFVVSKAGRAMRQGELHKQFKGQVTVLPELRELSVVVSLYRVLAGHESLADFTAKAVRSVETAVTVDAYTTFATAMNALDNTGDDALRFAGYTQDTLVGLCQKVSAWNGGNKAVICGTQLALQDVLPADANYRYDLQSDYVKIGYVQTAFGSDILCFPQVAAYATPFTLSLADNRLWVISPSANKLVKLVLEGATLANTTGPYDNANLTQVTTLYKSFGSAIATNSVAGVIELS